MCFLCTSRKINDRDCVKIRGSCVLFSKVLGTKSIDLMGFVHEVFLQNSLYEGYSNDSGHTVY